MIIDQLPSVGTPALTDETVTEQGQNLFKVTWQRLLNLFKANTTTSELTNDAGFVNATQAASAAPVQSVNGMTGAVTIPSASLSDDNPQPLGTATPGTSTNVSRADHVHAMPSADAVGAMSKWDLMWANASPTSAFAAQTVGLDLSDYDAVKVEFYASDFAANCWEFGTVGAVRRTQAFMAVNGRHVRNFLATSTGVVFSKGEASSGQSTGVGDNNGTMIPQRIFGIKGVNS